MLDKPKIIYSSHKHTLNKALFWKMSHTHPDEQRSRPPLFFLSTPIPLSSFPVTPCCLFTSTQATFSPLLCISLFYVLNSTSFPCASFLPSWCSSNWIRRPMDTDSHTLGSTKRSTCTRCVQTTAEAATQAPGVCYDVPYLFPRTQQCTHTHILFFCAVVSQIYHEFQSVISWSFFV